MLGLSVWVDGSASGDLVGAEATRPRGRRGKWRLEWHGRRQSGRRGGRCEPI